MNIFSKLLRICNAFPKRFRSTISIIFLSKNFFRMNPTIVLEAPNIINLEQCEPIIVHQTLYTTYF